MTPSRRQELYFERKAEERRLVVVTMALNTRGDLDAAFDRVAARLKALARQRIKALANARWKQEFDGITLSADDDFHERWTEYFRSAAE